MKTYNERLQEFAEEFARIEYQSLDEGSDTFKAAVINHYEQFARIALKHMAEAYRMAVDEDGAHRKYGLDEYLVKLGLEPQTT